MFADTLIIGTRMFWERTSGVKEYASVFSSRFFCLKLHIAPRNLSFSSCRTAFLYRDKSLLYVFLSPCHAVNAKTGSCKSAASEFLFLRNLEKRLLASASIFSSPSLPSAVITKLRNNASVCFSCFLESQPRRSNIAPRNCIA